MSTPTTATATLPPHYRHHHHPSHHYPPYPNLSTAGSSYRAVAIAGVASNPILPTTTSTASTATVSNQHQSQSSSSYTTSQLYSASSQTLRPSPNGVAASIATTRPTQDSARTNSTPRLDAYKASMPPSTASTTQTFSDGQPRKRRRSKEPDWKTFYKNGLPKEIIVIDDTPEPDEKPALTSSSRTHANEDATRQGPKRRRKEDVVRNDDAYSRVNGSYQQTSNSGSTSTDRTTSAHNTTAATSLGSLSSNGQYDYETRQVGQKRKRTRQQIAQEAKRREIEVLGDAFVTYRPPQKPVKKAGDVTVRSVNDVSLLVRKFVDRLLTIVL